MSLPKRISFPIALMLWLALSRNAAASPIDCTESSDTGYVDGNPFTINVVTVDGKPVERNTANAFAVMADAAALDGLTLTIVSGFRTMAEQQYLYDCYVNCSCNGCNLAATPGYSNHQSGHALDLNTGDAGVYDWLTAHGAEYGFERTVPSEDWHWEWWGGGPGGGPCGTTPTTTPGCTPAIVAGAESEVFEDMPAGSIGHDEAILLYDAGLTSGCSSSPRLFCPSCTTSRAQMVSFLVRAEVIDTSSPPSTPTFADVPSDLWSYPFVEAAAAAGITSGCGGGNFCPDDPVTRGQSAALIARTRGWPDASPTTPTFADVPSTHPFFGAIEALAARCVATGDGTGNFAPDDPLDRAPSAVFLARAYDLDNINTCIDSGAVSAGGAGGTGDGFGGSAGVSGSAGSAGAAGSSGAGAGAGGSAVAGSGGDGTGGVSASSGASGSSGAPATVINNAPGSSDSSGSCSLDPHSGATSRARASWLGLGLLLGAFVRRGRRAR